MREILALLPKPSRYLGMEEGAVHPDLHNVKLHCVLAFPDMYEVGMSYLGQKIIYGQLNAMDGVAAERVFTPCRDAAAILRQYKVPLATLESDTPLAQTHFLGFSITTELAFTNILYMLDLAGIPLHQEDRGDDLFAWPLVVAGGGCTICAEPVAPFLDIMTLGESEAVLPPLLNLLIKARAEKWSKSAFLMEARHLPGIYIPSFFDMDSEGRLTPKFADYTRIQRRAVADMHDAFYPISQTVPFGAVHNRLSLEIARGCTRGCRFCQAGMTLRPSRERSIAELHEIMEKCLSETGFDDVSFLSLSCGDFSGMKELFLQAADRCAAEQISISLPSLRVGSVDGDIMAKMADIRRTGATLAPEAGTQRLRDVINKGITEEALIHHVRQLVGYGWQQVKLYFMIGLPTETYEDLDGIVAICAKVRDCCRYKDEETGKWRGTRITVTAAVSPFVPKTHTPFQWDAQISKEEMFARVRYLREQFRSQKALTLRWHEPAMSHLEGILSRADRRLAPVVEKAYKKGGIFSSWVDGFELQPWLDALQECGMNPEDWTRERSLEESLPWDHLESGVSREFLLKERERALRGAITEDCRYHPCRQCGACDTKAGPSRLRACDDLTKEPLLHTTLNYPQRDQVDFGPIPTPPAAGAKAEPPSMDKKLSHRAVRYRIWHQKKGQSAFLSQLEIQSLLDRSMRRAQLPLAFSQGFHPLPLLTFGMALPVSVASESEWFVITLRIPMTPEEVHRRLAPYMLQGMALKSVETLPLTGTVASASAERFRIECLSADVFGGIITAPSRPLVEYMQNFAAQEDVPLTRVNKKGVTKIINIRKFLTSWNALAENKLEMTLSWREGYLSPLTFVHELAPEIDPALLRITKLEQFFD